MQRLKRHKFAVFLILICLMIAGVFGVRLVRSALYWSDPARVEQPLSGWMSLRYVAKLRRVDPGELSRELGLEAYRGQHLSLGEIATAEGQDWPSFEAALTTAIDRLHGKDHPHD